MLHWQVTVLIGTGNRIHTVICGITYRARTNSRHYWAVVRCTIRQIIVFISGRISLLAVSWTSKTATDYLLRTWHLPWLVAVISIIELMMVNFERWIPIVSSLISWQSCPSTSIVLIICGTIIIIGAGIATHVVGGRFFSWGRWQVSQATQPRALCIVLVIVVHIILHHISVSFITITSHLIAPCIVLLIIMIMRMVHVMVVVIRCIVVCSSMVVSISIIVDIASVDVGVRLAELILGWAWPLLVDCWDLSHNLTVIIVTIIS